MIQLMIQDHLIIPWGVPKWNIDKIKIVGVSTKATYFETETPCVYIDKKRERALCIGDIGRVLPDRRPFSREYDNIHKAVELTQQCLEKYCKMDTEDERRFLTAYLAHCSAHHGETRHAPDNKAVNFFDALLPIPQAHLYAHDPLNDTYSFAPNNMFKVDFAFWTGEQIVAVEIDGASHIGSRSHIRKDRLLQRSDVHVVHIMNDEIREYGTKAIERLLPLRISHYYWHNWDDDGAYRHTNPFCPSTPG